MTWQRSNPQPLPRNRNVLLYTVSTQLSHRHVPLRLGQSSWDGNTIFFVSHPQPTDTTPPLLDEAFFIACIPCNPMIQCNDLSYHISSGCESPTFSLDVLIIMQSFGYPVSEVYECQKLSSEAQVHGSNRRRTLGTRLHNIVIDSQNMSTTTSMDNGVVLSLLFAKQVMTRPWSSTLRGPYMISLRTRCSDRGVDVSFSNRRSDHQEREACGLPIKHIHISPIGPKVIYVKAPAENKIPIQTQ